MIPYNPSSFNSNKTILEQILELKRWLQAHPSYEVFYSSEAGNTSQAITSYDLTAVTDPTNMEIGDVVVFHNSTFGVVTSVDTDNNEFGCDPCISLTGPTGPQGPTGVSITNVSVDASNHLICTLSNGTTIDAGVIQYDTYISLTGSSGTLTDDEYAKALLNDTKIIETIGTSTLIYTKYSESSSNIVYTVLVPIDVNPSPSTTTQNITINKSTHAWTKTAYKIPIGIDNIKSGAYSSGRTIISDGNGGAGWYFMEGGGIKSTGATSGQVLQADGNGGASWQAPATPSVEGTSVLSTGATSGQVLQADGNGGASWQNAGGGSTLYAHYVCIDSSSYTQQLNILIINNSSAPFTTFDEVATYLYNNLGAGKSMMATGFNQTTGPVQSRKVTKVRANSTMNLNMFANGDDASGGWVDFTRYNASVEDNVMTIS